MAAGRPPVGR